MRAIVQEHRVRGQKRCISASLTDLRNGILEVRGATDRYLDHPDAQRAAGVTQFAHRRFAIGRRRIEQHR